MHELPFMPTFVFSPPEYANAGEAVISTSLQLQMLRDLDDRLCEFASPGDFDRLEALCRCERLEDWLRALRCMLWPNCAKFKFECIFPTPPLQTAELLKQRKQWLNLRSTATRHQRSQIRRLPPLRVLTSLEARPPLHLPESMCDEA